MRAPTITLLTDFGEDGPYAGELRAVLRARAPEAVLADLSHEVPPHDVGAAAYLLAAAAFRFPRGTVHLAVVDPGVGGSRRPIAARVGAHLFVAPDNGLLTLVLAADPGRAEVREIAHPGLRAPAVHPTFHGRDLFAPAAAALARGLELEEVGPPVAAPVLLSGLVPHRAADGSLELPVLHVDRFGNVTLAAGRRWLERRLGGRPPLRLEQGGAPLPWVRTYAEAPPGTPVLLWGSSGFLEIALREASAAGRLGCSPGARLRLIPA